MKSLGGLCGRLLEDLWISGMIVFLLFTVDSLNHLWVYANEVPHARPLGSFRVGAFKAWKTNHVIKRVGFEPGDISPTLWEGRGTGDWVVKWAMIQSVSCVMKSSLKLWTLRLGWAFLVGNHTSVCEGDVSWGPGGFMLRLSQTLSNVSFPLTSPGLSPSL